MVPQKCQKAFGRCDSDAIPMGGNTSTDARPLVGEVSYDERIEHCLKQRTIALTFDDGPSEHTHALLDLLKSHNAKGTFFVGGNNNGKGEIDTTKEWFGLIRRMVEEGHQLGSHTFNHVRLSKAPSELRKIEMLKNERAMANIIGE
jgi:peptidoglycan/xylan/chitin deacetylase (PgdA/CDA1 family)